MRYMEHVRAFPLTEGLIKEYLIDEDLFPVGETHHLDHYRSKVQTCHESLGGMEPTAKNPQQLVPNCLGVLKRKGLYENPRKGYWKRVQSVTSESATDDTISRSPDIEHGVGNEVVYGWYLPLYRTHADSLGETIFPMKIGRSTKQASLRVQESIGIMPEQPVIGYCYQTDQSSHFERLLHILLTLSDRHVSTAEGTEWFRTCPFELELIVSRVERLIKDVHGEVFTSLSRLRTNNDRRLEELQTGLVRCAQTTLDSDND